MDAFVAERLAYVDFCTRLSDLIKQLLQDAGLRPLYMEQRVKEWSSLKRKLEREEKDVEDWVELHDIGDLAGVRAIFLYRDEVDQAAALLRPEFEICKPDRHWDPGDPEWFGYATCQWSVCLNGDRAKQTGWKDHRSKQAEIQLRTLLQHAWSECNHPWAYKALGVRPAALRRRFARLAAILEIGDLELTGLADESKRLKDHYRDLVASGKFGEVELNVDSLEVFLEDGDPLADVLSIAVEIGYQYDEDLRPRVGEPSKFVRYAVETSVNSIGSLVALVHSVNNRRTDLARILAETRARNLKPDPAALPLDILIFLLVLDHPSAFRLLKRRADEDFSDTVVDALSACMPTP